MTALASLLSDIRACTLCAEHLPMGPRPVVQASETAKVLIVGQAPGRLVHETGIPFNDPSGDRLRRWMGVTREQFYDPTQFAIIPMGFCFPGTAKGGDLPPRPECATTWRAKLLAALPDIELTLVIGMYARNWHLPDERRKSLKATCERWTEFWPDMLPMPHPSPRNIRWFAQNPWFEQDVVPVLQARLRKRL